MRKLLLLLFFACPALFAAANVYGVCSPGAKPVVVAGFAGAPQTLGMYPSCTVTVYLTGTSNKATIFSDNNGTSKANPFTASSSGNWTFYVADGIYDVTVSGGGIPSPYTFGAINVVDYYFASIEGGLTGSNARSKNAKLADSIQVTDYGADPTGSADSTSAISAAITAVQSWPTIVSNAPPPCIHFAAGTYKVSSAAAQVFHITFSNLCIYGDGPWNTTIATVSGSTIIFNLGTFSASQYPPYVANAGGFSLSDLRIVNTAQLALTNTGSRTTVGVQANGNGQVTMHDVQCEGLQYCFAGPYGSNFDRFYNIWSDQNDVGIYLGPASQQDSIIAFESGASGEGIVMDLANSNQVLNSTFEDSMTADVTFENERPTRMGWTESSMLGDPEFSDTLQGLWLETGSGSGYSTWQEYIRIWMKTNTMDSSYPRHIIMRDLFFVLGNTGIAAQDGNPHPLIECDSCRFISADNLTIQGNRWTTGVYMNGGNKFALSNFTIEDGYTQTTPLYTFANGSDNNDSTYRTPFFTKGYEPIPTACSSGDQLYYDFTIQNWAGCLGTTTGGGSGDSGGPYAYFAQLDSTFHLPNDLLPIAATLTGPLVVNGEEYASVNGISLTIYGGNSATNDGYWWFQNGGNPVYTFNLAGHNPAGTPTVVLAPVNKALNSTGNGSVEAGFFVTDGTTFANLGTPSGGTMVYCTDCTINTSAPYTCAGSGTGAWAFRRASGSWACPF